MIKNESEEEYKNVCDLIYLNEIMGGKKNLVKGVMDVFLIQIPEELKSINDAVSKTNYPVIKSFAHTMKSSVSIMGISILVPILKEMEDLAAGASNFEKIKELNLMLNLICKQAMEEIGLELPNYA